MMRPSDSHDLRLHLTELEITPKPVRLRWIHDVFGNSVAVAAFDTRDDRLTFVSNVVVDHKSVPAFTRDRKVQQLGGGPGKTREVFIRCEMIMLPDDEILVGI